MLSKALCSSIMAVCKPRYWNLDTGIGIGIEIGTDTTNTISSTRPMDTKPSRMVT